MTSVSTARINSIVTLFQKRVDTVGLNEKRRKEEREEVKKNWLPGKGDKVHILLSLV